MKRQHSLTSSGFRATRFVRTRRQSSLAKNASSNVLESPKNLLSHSLTGDFQICSLRSTNFGTTYLVTPPLLYFIHRRNCSAAALLRALRVKADFVVEGGLSKILPLVRNGAEPERSLSKNNFAREAIRMESFFIPFICRYLLDYRIVSSIISVVALLFLLSELFKLRGRRTPLFSAVTRAASTTEELNKFTTAPPFFALGVVISLLLFPQPLGFASIAILTLGDGTATLFGGKWGRTRFPFNKGKTLEASAFGFLFAFAGAHVFVGYLNALIGAFVGMFIECLPLPVDDNLATLTCGLVLKVLS